MYLLVDFSNAARRLLTRTKLAQKLGGMADHNISSADTIKKSISKLKMGLEDAVPEPKAKARPKYSFGEYGGNLPEKGQTKEMRDILKNNDRSSSNKEYIKERLNIRKQITTKEKQLAQKTKEKDRGYVDAIQIARRGSTTPIKSKSGTYIDRSSALQNPQDNTVLTAAQKRVGGDLRNERAITVEKNTPTEKLKTSSLRKGTDTQVASIKPSQKAVYSTDIHSHPYGKGKASIIPSIDDYQTQRRGVQGASLIVSPTPKGRTVTKYNTNKSEGYVNIAKDLPNTRQTRKDYRKSGFDYTVITKGKNQ